MSVIGLGDKVTLAEAGGKGLNLCLLVEQGFNVPRGYIITTDAYQRFVETNELQEVITNEISGIDEDVESLQRASANIRHMFSAGIIPRDTEDQIIEAYYQHKLGKVAVRSSATAEDLPETSFAGQQDTYLNVEGEEELLKAVVDCWSSLWTPRAIGYRKRNRISQKEVSLAVVVQEMVQSEASGVLFTVNPLTGVRTEAVINATFGLGEALVSGQIEPDEYIVDKETGTIKSVKIGTKTGSSDQALSEQQINELVEIGREIENYYATPQDIEWATYENQLYVLQSRPVTGLYPLPEGAKPDPLEVYGSFGHIQGVLQPLTPMGIDVILQMLGYIQQKMGGTLSPRENKRFFGVGGRLYSNASEMFRNTRYRELVEMVLSYVEPGMADAAQEILEDPRIEKRKKKPSVKEIRLIVPVMVPFLCRFIGSVLRPVAMRERMNRKIESETTKWRKTLENVETFEENVAYIHKLLESMHRTILKYILPTVAAGQGMFFPDQDASRETGLG